MNRKKPYNLEDLKSLMATLRGPKGCPWDKEQTPESLTPYAIEEAFEVEEAVFSGNHEALKDELGDLLFQVIFHGQMSSEAGGFTVDEVIHHLTEKMIRRHPHVFAPDSLETAVDSAEQVKVNWEKSKTKNLESNPMESVPKNFPSLLRAHKIGKKAKTIRFDWSTSAEVWKQVESEWQELQQATTKEHKEEELGDLLFSLAQWARHEGLDAETALRKANKKVCQRVNKAKDLFRGNWQEFADLPEEKKELLWKQVKSQEPF